MLLDLSLSRTASYCDQEDISEDQESVACVIKAISALHELEESVKESDEEHALKLIFCNDKVDDRIDENELDHEGEIVASRAIAADHEILDEP